MRKERGLDWEREWDIWRDGCEGGEYVVLNFHPLPGLVVIDGPLLIPSCFINLQIYAASQRASRQAHLANPKYAEASHERGGAR